MAEGGEGAVWLVKGRPKTAAKIYQSDKRTKEHADKVQAMLARPPVDPTRDKGHIPITWPEASLRENGAFAGYLMPKINNSKTILEAYNLKLRAEKFKNFHWGYSVRTAINLCWAMAALRQANYVIGDINENNILVSDRAVATSVDTDSFQVPDPQTGKTYRCVVGVQSYTPPELRGVPLELVNRADEQDRFGLAIMLLKLLMESKGMMSIIRRSSKSSLRRRSKRRMAPRPTGRRASGRC